MKRIWQKLIAAVLVATTVFGGCTAQVYADEGEESAEPRTEISLSPTMSVVTLIGGDIIAEGSDKCPQDISAGCAVEVKNTGDTKFRFRVHVTPYAVSGEDNSVSFDESASNEHSQITRWITFRGDNGEYAQEYIGELEPGEARTVYYRILVPDDIPSGAQYAAIWAQTINDSNTSLSVQTTGEAGMTLRGRAVGTTVRTGEISDYDFQRFSFGGKLDAHATVKNTGNTDYEVNYSYTARTIFGKEMYSEKKSIAAWPGSEYHINIDWEDTPLMGIFTVNFSVNAADATENHSHIVAIIPVFVIVLCILLLTVIIIWIIIIIRKRKERKARTLV